MKNFIHSIKNYYLRLRFGAGCCDLYNLDVFISEKLLPIMKKYKEVADEHYPCDLKAHKDWNKIIDKIILSFELIIKDDFVTGKEMIKREKEIQEGLDLFAKYFRDLWI